MVSVIEADFCFLQMQVEGVFGNAAEPCQALFGQTPEALDAVDVVDLAGELIVSVLDPEVLVIAQVEPSRDSRLVHRWTATPRSCIISARSL